MAKMTRTKLAAIIKRDAPGYKIVTNSTFKKRGARAEASSPDVTSPRRGKSSAIDGSYKRATRASRIEDDEIVIIEPASEELDRRHGPGPKAVVVSGKEGRVVGRQG